jgi:DNA invertase Pin-like site-specific DNA recombinase
VQQVVHLKGRKAELKVLSGQGAMVDTTGPEGRLVFDIFAALAECERDLIPRKLTPLPSALARAQLDAETDMTFAQRVSADGGDYRSTCRMTGMAEAERQFRVASSLYDGSEREMKVQDLDLQIDALQAAGCEALFHDTVPDVAADRGGLVDAIGRCAAGDVLVVWKLERLGPTLSDLVKHVEALKQQEVELKVLLGQGAVVDTTMPQGRFLFGIFAILAELGRERVKMRKQSAKKGSQHVVQTKKLAPLDARTDAPIRVGYTCPPLVHPFPKLHPADRRPFIDQSCYVEFRDDDGYANGRSLKT